MAGRPAPHEGLARRQVRLGQALADGGAQAAARHAVHVPVRPARIRAVDGGQLADVRRRYGQHLGRRRRRPLRGCLRRRGQCEPPPHEPRAHRRGDIPVRPKGIGRAVAPQHDVVVQAVQRRRRRKLDGVEVEVRARRRRLLKRVHRVEEEAGGRREPRHHAPALPPVDNEPPARRGRVKRFQRVEDVARPQDFGAGPRQVRRRHAQHEEAARHEEAVNVRGADVLVAHRRENVRRARRRVDAEEAVRRDAAELEVHVEQVARLVVALRVGQGQRALEGRVEALRLRAVPDGLERVLVDHLQDRIVRRQHEVARRRRVVAARRPGAAPTQARHVAHHHDVVVDLLVEAARHLGKQPDARVAALRKRDAPARARLLEPVNVLLALPARRVSHRRRGAAWLIRGRGNVEPVRVREAVEPVRHAVRPVLGRLDLAQTRPRAVQRAGSIRGNRPADCQRYRASVLRKTDKL